MQCNVGGVDRTIRFVVGAIIIGLGLYYQSWWGLLGAVVFLTAVFSRCPAYLPFGLSTCKSGMSAPTGDTPQGPQN